MTNSLAKIFLTGGTGLLGSRIRKFFSASGYVVNSDRIEIRSYEKLVDNLTDFSPNYVIHTAAITDVKACESDKELCQSVNVNGTKNVLNVARKLSIPIIYISTASVFEGTKKTYKEYDVAKPTNYYSQSKLEGESFVLEYEKGMVVRLNLIGLHEERTTPKNFFEWALCNILQNNDMNLFNDVFTNPLSDITCAYLLKRIIDDGITESILHFGSRTSLSKAEIVKYMVKKIGTYTGKISELSIDTLSGPDRPKNMVLNVSRTENRLKISMPTLEQEIDTLLENRKLLKFS